MSSLHEAWGSSFVSCANLRRYRSHKVAGTTLMSCVSSDSQPLCGERLQRGQGVPQSADAIKSIYLRRLPFRDANRGVEFLFTLR